MFYQNKPPGGRRKGRKMPFVSLEALTLDLDLQSHPNEGPNTSSLWIWHKSIQRFTRYFIHKQNSHRPHQKQNLPQFSACGNDVPTVQPSHRTCCTTTVCPDSKQRDRHCQSTEGNHNSTHKYFYRLDALPDAQPTVSKHQRQQSHNNNYKVEPTPTGPLSFALQPSPFLLTPTML